MPNKAVFSRQPSVISRLKKKKEVKTIRDGEIKIEIPKTITKRDGRVVEFEVGKIEKAIKLCFEDLNRTPSTGFSELSKRVVNIIGAKYAILYRAEHAKLREERPIPVEVAEAFATSDQYFGNQVQKFQFFNHYSRFNWDLGRRETWVETVDRAVDYMAELADGRLEADTFNRIRKTVLEMKAAPSMRLLAMAGQAARRSNIAIYNCSYLPVDSVDSFVEALLISMNGCGVGFSVEGKYVENLPRVKRQTGAEARTHLIEDTTEGWGEAIRLGLSTWFDGGDIKFDYSALRPAGAILRVKGGRSSGPEPLRQTLEFARAKLFSRQGSFLRPIDAHDVMCEVGSAAVSGGMRRTAMISLFDFDDT
ncbi:recombinase, partial [Candidatus Collierbacteria bacterium]|nr:recombinase [Candidatus Collierbacteria bacterium]